jgi:hypothetical protein
MLKEKQEITPVQSVTDETPAPAPAGEQMRDPMTSTDGPLLSGLVPPDSTLLPGTVTKFPQDFNEERDESDRSNESLGTDAGVDPTHGSSGSDADNDVDYNGASSEEERRSPENQSVPGEDNQPSGARPETTEPINQPAPINQQLCTLEANKKTINPAGQDENKTLTEEQSTFPTLENPINHRTNPYPVGLS